MTTVSIPSHGHNQHSHNNNNNSAMERVLFHLHRRVCNFGLEQTSSHTRRLLEHGLLILAILCFGALILLHRSFVYRGALVKNCASTCLLSIPNFNAAAADITHLILPQQKHQHQNQHQHQHQHQHQNQQTPSSSTIRSSYIVWHNTTTTGTGTGACADTIDEMATCTASTNNETCSSTTPSTSTSTTTTTATTASRPLLPQNSTISYSFSTTKAFLLLPPNHKLLEQLNIQYVMASPNDPHCFGDEPFLQSLVMGGVFGSGDFLDTIVLNWLLAVLDADTTTSTTSQEDDNNQHQHQHQQQHQQQQDNIPHGFIHHAKTNRVQELTVPMSVRDHQHARNAQNHTNHTNHTNTNSRTHANDISDLIHRLRIGFLPLSHKLGVLLQTSFLFFFCTTLVSFTLRETQEKMLEFTQELSRRVSVSLPLSDLVTTHVVSNLVFVPIMVGMMFFLIEFYSGDKFLAFLVMSIVWFVEVFSVISLRSYQGLRFFPRIFFLLFCLFHIYYFANPYGFAYMALIVVACFMWHSMVFFWHRYELPAVALGRVTVDRPRITNEAVLYHNTTLTSNINSPLRSETRGAGGVAVVPQPDDLPVPSQPVLGHADDEGEEASSHTNNLLARSHASFSTTSSRNTSAGLFRNNTEEDDDESYVYFMEGEVVLHRRQQQQQQQQQHLHLHDDDHHNHPQNLNRGDELASTSNPQGGHEHLLLLDHSLGLDISEQSTSEEDNLLIPLPSSPPQRSETAATTNNTPTTNTNNASQADYPDESSGLQAILEVRLTPRHRNTAADRRAATAPTFPNLPP